MDEIDAYFRRAHRLRLGPATIAEVRRTAQAARGETDGVLAEVRGADLATGAARTVCVVLSELPS